MATKIQVRRDTAANWTSANTVLSSGEMGYETDTGYMKIGDGTTAWGSLSYFTPGDVSDDNTTYTISVAQSGGDANVTLTGSDASNDTVTMVAGNNLTVTVAGDNVTMDVDNDLANYSNATSAFISNITAEAIGSLSDVDVSAVANGSVLSYNSTSGNWEAGAPAVGAISDLSDVDTSGAAFGAHLQYDGANWTSQLTDFNAGKTFLSGLSTNRFIQYRNAVITIGAISSGDSVDFPTDSGTDAAMEWEVNNPGTDFVANITPGPVNINRSQYFRIIIDNTTGATKGSISGLERFGTPQTVNWTNGSLPVVSGDDVYDIYEFYCFRGDGGSDETWYGTLVTGNTFNNLADTDLTSVNTNDLIYMGSSGKLEADSILRSLYTFGEVNMLKDINHNMEWDTASYSGTDGDTITFNTGSYISTGTSGRIYFEDVDHNFTLDITNLSTVNKVSQKFLVAVDNRQRQETRVDSGTVSPLSVPSLGQTLIINGVTVTASGAGTTSFIDDINTAGITNVRAESLTNAIRIVGENNTSITLDAGGTAMSDLGLSAGTTTPTTVGSPGKGLTGLKINSRDVTIVWADGKVPTAKLGRIDFYEIERMNGPTYADLDICFIRHFNRDQNISGDLTGSVFADDSTVLIDGTEGTINLDGTVSGNLTVDNGNIKVAGDNADFILENTNVNANEEVFGNIIATTGSVEYGKVVFKAGPDSYTDNGEVNWITRIQGSDVTVFEIKGSTLSKSGIVFNPTGNAEVDFYMAGATDGQLLYVDAGDDKVGIGKLPTQGKLDVDGDVYADNLNGTVVATFNLGASGTDHYVFSDSDNHWFPTSENDPTLYLRRGETYVFNNTSGAHPFQIQSVAGAGGAAYSTGVTNNNTVGVVTFKVPMSAPATLYYQCTSHANMGGTMNII